MRCLICSLVVAAAIPPGALALGPDPGPPPPYPRGAKMPRGVSHCLRYEGFAIAFKEANAWNAPSYGLGLRQRFVGTVFYFASAKIARRWRWVVTRVGTNPRQTEIRGKVGLLWPYPNSGPQPSARTKAQVRACVVDRGKA